MVKFCDEVLRSFGINNLVAFRQPCVLTQISNYLPLLKRTRNKQDSDQPGMASRPLLYITDKLLTYVVIWSAASCSSLLNIYVPLCIFLQSLTHLSAHSHYIFVPFPHLPGMFFSDMYLLSRKNRFLFVMFSAPSL